MSLPDHTRRLAEQRLQSYCQRICPPEFHTQVRLTYRVEGDRATVFEVRPLCFWTLGLDALRHVPLAQFRYDARAGAWRFYHRSDAGTWARYRSLPQARDVLALLRELDRDPQGLFWQRVNGKSLRWCSARGRCADCTHRYEQILQLDRGTETAEIRPIEQPRRTA